MTTDGRTNLLINRTSSLGGSGHESDSWDSASSVTALGLGVAAEGIGVSGQGLSGQDLMTMTMWWALVLAVMANWGQKDQQTILDYWLQLRRAL